MPYSFDPSMVFPGLVLCVGILIGLWATDPKRKKRR